MNRGRWHPSRCYYCGATVEEVGHISARGKCPTCGKSRMNANRDELIAGNGEHFDHWLRRIRASVLPLAQPRSELERRVAELERELEVARRELERLRPLVGVAA